MTNPRNRPGEWSNGKLLNLPSTHEQKGSIFPKAVRLLQESDVLVIVRYSLSEEDALLRFLIRQFAEDLRDVHGKSIFYVDYTDANVLEERLQGCFRSMNRMDVNNVFTFSGGFVEWIDQILRRT